MLVRNTKNHIPIARLPRIRKRNSLSDGLGTDYEWGIEMPAAAEDAAVAAAGVVPVAVVVVAAVSTATKTARAGTPNDAAEQACARAGHPSVSGQSRPFRSHCSSYRSTYYCNLEDHCSASRRGRCCLACSCWQ